MEVWRLTLADLARRLRSPTAGEQLSPAAGVCCVQLDIGEQPVATPLLANCPVVAVVENAKAPDVVDVHVSSEAEAARVVEAVRRNPFAAAVLVRLLRHNERSSVEDGLFAESLAYSSLQHGGEFRTWLAKWRVKPRRPQPAATAAAVVAERAGGQLRITLNRPRKRNAYASEMRDALCEQLALALEDASISHVVLAGAGACFGAGGDLDEFGEATDAALAHCVRVTRNAGALMHRVRARAHMEARLHGACIGAGIELPAFAGRVVAHRDTFFQLPEVGMGLIPGAGGTVSILPRIGRRRLAFMALTGARVDAEAALAWGLVDAIA